MISNALGLLNTSTGEFNAAEKYFAHAIVNLKKAEEPDIHLLANTLGNLGLMYLDIADYPKARKNLIDALDLTRSIVGNKHADYAACLSNLGLLNEALNEFNIADSLYNLSLVIEKEIFGEMHPDYAKSLFNIGMIKRNLGDYTNALIYIKQFLYIQVEILGEDNIDYAHGIEELADIYNEIGEYLLAEFYLNKSLDLKKKILGEVHFEYANTLENIGYLKYEFGDHQTALQYYNRSLEIKRNILGVMHPECAYTLNRIGLLYNDIGEFRSAENYYVQAINIQKKILGTGHLDYAQTLSNMGNLYLNLGNFNLTELNYKNALLIYKNKLGESHPDYARMINNYGVFLENNGNKKEAGFYYQKSFDIIKNKYGSDHPIFANSLHNLGCYTRNIGQYSVSEMYFKQSLDISRRNFGEHHSFYISSLNDLGSLFTLMGDFKSASDQFSKALKLISDSSDEYHLEYLNTLINFGLLNIYLSDFKLSEDYYGKALNKINTLVISNFSWLSNEEKKAFWNKYASFYSQLNNLSVLSDLSILSSTSLSYNSNLISKSLLLETSRELDQAITQSSDVELKAQFAEMKQLRRVYSKMQSEGSDKKDIMERFNAQADSLDKILVNKLGEYASSKRKFEITWKDIQYNITSTEAAIEFARYFDDKDSAYKYLALVVRPGYDYPKLVKLGKEEDIRRANQPKGQDFAALYDLVWRGVDSLLTGVNTVYYSPAGELNNLAFSALCFSAGELLVASLSGPKRGEDKAGQKEIARSCTSLLMDKYSLHQLTTTRYLADGTLKKEKPLQPSLALLGGINFDEVPFQSKVGDKEQSKEDFALLANLNNREASANGKKKGKRSSSKYGEKMKPLPGTKEEVTNIAGLLEASNWQVQTKTDQRAGEYEFKKELETTSPGILHIATHGFSFPDEAKKESKLTEMNQTSTYKVSEDPMVRCGLMLSGSNISWTGNPKKMIEQTGDDGILTAAEVANLDLSSTKLAVLSACETGLGKIEGSEGTFGLKRGFKLAGVEQMIVSLWSVPDKETMELMTLFYTDLTKTLNPVISFEKAQKEMRFKYPTEPEKWAGFVLVR
jgi:tetratricopeptide (TPR) repeat protein